MPTLQIKETYAFTHNNITVYVKIDYANGQISLVDPFERRKSKFQKKTWIFAERELQYMQGWLDILDTMKEAIKDAQKKLKAYQDVQSEKVVDDLVNMRKEILGKK